MTENHKMLWLLTIAVNFFISVLFLSQRLVSGMPPGEALSKFGIAVVIGTIFGYFLSYIISRMR